MFKQLFLVLLVITSSLLSAQASEEIFSCKEEYDSDYNEHIFTSTSLTHENNNYKLTIIDHNQLVEFYNTLYNSQNESVGSLEVVFSRCIFSKEYRWEINCSRPQSAFFYDQNGKSIATLSYMDISSGHFSTEEENTNWFFSSLALSVGSNFAEIKSQYHPEDNCKTKY